MIWDKYEWVWAKNWLVGEVKRKYVDDKISKHTLESMWSRVESEKVEE